MDMNRLSGAFKNTIDKIRSLNTKKGRTGDRPLTASRSGRRPEGEEFAELVIVPKDGSERSPRRSIGADRGRDYAYGTARRRSRTADREAAAPASPLARLSAKAEERGFKLNGRRLAMVAGALALCIAIPVAALSISGADDDAAGKNVSIAEVSVAPTISPDVNAIGAQLPESSAEVGVTEQPSAPAEAPTPSVPLTVEDDEKGNAGLEGRTTQGDQQDISTGSSSRSDEGGASLLGTVDGEGSDGDGDEPNKDNKDEKASALKPGITSAEVAKLQERLMDLHYMDEDEPTEYYGPATENAVSLFQRKHELEQDGVAGEATLALLYSDSAKNYSVTVGISGDDVYELQKRLVELSYLDSATGYFGTDTEEAVKRFQEKNSLTADGSVGYQTRELLYSEDAKVNSYGYGTSGDDVTRLQSRLVKLGYLLSEEADGVYGSGTTLAVKRFQSKNGLIADGAVGEQTRELLFSDSAQANAVILGMSGSDVTKIQDRLAELKYMNSSTGYFGSATESAVKKFQSRNGLTDDGKVGKATLNKLFSDDAKAASSGSSSKPSEAKKPTSTKKPDKDKDDDDKKKNDDDKNIATDPADKDKVEELIAVAESRLGCKYVRGGKGSKTFDCSGFVYWCINEVGVNQSYMTSATWQKCTKYPKVKSMSDLQRGDIISFRGHVGIYLGNGKMIDASSTQGKVRITSSDIRESSYWKSHFVCGFRVL